MLYLYRINSDFIWPFFSIILFTLYFLRLYLSVFFLLVLFYSALLLFKCFRLLYILTHWSTLSSLFTIMFYFFLMCYLGLLIFFPASVILWFLGWFSVCDLLAVIVFLRSFRLLNFFVFLSVENSTKLYRPFFFCCPRLASDTIFLW